METITVPNNRFFLNKHLGENGETLTGLFDWQIDWLTYFDNKKARFSILEIHRRARKSSTALNLAIRECDEHPKKRYCIVAPTFAEARRIYWDDPTMLNDALPDQRVLTWSKDKQRLVVTFGNGSILQFLGGDDPDNLRGIDAEGFIFDEWAQCKEECYTEILQPIIRQDPKRWVAFLYTPKGMNHAPRMFDKACCLDDGGSLPVGGRADKLKKGWYAARLDANHTGIIPKVELEAAKEETPEAYYNQEYLCARIMEEEMVLISSFMLDQLNRKMPYPDTTKRIVSCDPSMGGDECTIKVFHNTHILEEKQIRTRDTMRIVGELIMLGNKYKIPSFVVDCIGIGQGICDRLTELDQDCYAFNSAGESDTVLARNKRAAMWWYVMQQVRQNLVEYPKDAETRRQIPYASRYKMVNGKVQIVDKLEIKKDLSCSPDRAEAWAMGIYGLQFVDESMDIDSKFIDLQRPPHNVNKEYNVNSYGIRAKIRTRA